MTTPRFARATLFTLGARIIGLLLGICISILLARLLGAEGKGVYAVATLVPSLVLTFANFGVGPATAYHVAQGRFPQREILGTGFVTSVAISVLATAVACLVVLFLGRQMFPDVHREILLLGLAAVPLAFLTDFFRSFLLGAQRFGAYNVTGILSSLFFLPLLFLALRAATGGVVGALLAGVLAAFLTVVVLLITTARTARGFAARPSAAFLRHASPYGAQAYLGGLLDLLNSRVDVFIVNASLGVTAVGFYSVGVGLAEQLWLLSFSASTVLFPRIAAETDSARRGELTPFVARTVLWTSTLGAVALFALSQWLVGLLYSNAFLPAVAPLRALLPGIVTFSVARVLANDLAGRGRIMLNNYAGVVTVTSNVVLNLLWVPRFGIVGAAWASTVSYTATFLIQVVMYCRLSGNAWTKVLIPQREDMAVYLQAARSLCSGLSRWEHPTRNSGTSDEGPVDK